MANSLKENKRKVLVVDDLKVNRVVLARMFHKLGFDVVEAENGQEAIAALEREHDDLLCVVLDLIMPVCNGYQAATRIRKLEQERCWARTPLIACTAENLEHRVDGNTVQASCLTSGFDSCMEKPMNPKVLVQLLKHYIPSFSHSLLGAEIKGTPRHRQLQVDQSQSDKLQFLAKDILSHASASNTAACEGTGALTGDSPFVRLGSRQKSLDPHTDLSCFRNRLAHTRGRNSMEDLQVAAW
jgi:CheY-like chemotaxis protein